MVCQAQGKYADAEPLFRRSLELRQKAFGPDHPYVAALLENMARCYREMGDTKEAEKLAARAKRIRSEQ
jgi:tetratricopeptide (TPR) repeat protein